MFCQVRTLRFLYLDKTDKNAIFIAAYNRRVKTGKQVCYLALWAYSKQERACHSISAKLACHDMILSMAVSECSNYAAIGTTLGSVGIYNVRDLSQPLLFNREVHQGMVTAVEFLPHRSYDATDLAGGRVAPGDAGCSESKPGAKLDGARCFLPGVCYNSRCAVVSLSVDQSIRLNRLPYPRRSTTAFICKLAMSSFLLYLLLWVIFIHWV